MKSTSPQTSSEVWRCETVARGQHGTKRRFEQFERVSFLLYTCLSCSTNTERASLFCSNYSVSGTGILYLAMNLQGIFVYNLPYTPPVIYRIIFQLVFGVGVHWTPIVPTCGNDLNIYSITGKKWANTIYELADTYNTTFNVWVEQGLYLAMNLQGTIVYWEEKGRGRVLR